MIIVSFVLPGGCRPVEKTDRAVLTLSIPDMQNTAMSSTLTLVAQTMTVPPTSTVIPTRTPLSFKEWKGLRVAYIIDGNLHVQDSGHEVIQLTNSGQDDEPVFSEDGQKIAFLRDRGPGTLYVINSDGTREQVVATIETLSSFGPEYDDSLTRITSWQFVPNTHKLLFNTYQPGTADPGTALWLPQRGNDLLLMDTDTGEIRQLLKPKQGGDFLVAPNGKWIAVQTPDHIDVIDIQGHVLRSHLVTYPPDEAHIDIPMFWTQNSNELIVLPSDISPMSAVGPMVRTVWRYSLDGRPGVQIPINPQPIFYTYGISPDGNWIAYESLWSESDPGSESDPDGVYIGNLRDGTSQLLYKSQWDPAKGSFQPGVTLIWWSPDSTHFIFGDDWLYLGDIHGEVTRLGNDGEISGWIDNKHYLLPDGRVGEIDKQEVIDMMECCPGAFVFLEH
jgi:dipeptidyl aminopeptidase/acylaminoacyl peptidase